MDGDQAGPVRRLSWLDRLMVCKVRLSFCICLCLFLCFYMSYYLFLCFYLFHRCVFVCPLSLFASLCRLSFSEHLKNLTLSPVKWKNFQKYKLFRGRRHTKNNEQKCSFVLLYIYNENLLYVFLSIPRDSSSVDPKRAILA